MYDELRKHLLASKTSTEGGGASSTNSNVFALFKQQREQERSQATSQLASQPPMPDTVSDVSSLTPSVLRGGGTQDFSLPSQRDFASTREYGDGPPTEGSQMSKFMSELNRLKQRKEALLNSKGLNHDAKYKLPAQSSFHQEEQKNDGQFKIGGLNQMLMPSTLQKSQEALETMRSQAPDTIPFKLEDMDSNAKIRVDGEAYDQFDGDANNCNLVYQEGQFGMTQEAPEEEEQRSPELPNIQEEARQEMKFYPQTTEKKQPGEKSDDNVSDVPSNIFHMDHKTGSYSSPIRDSAERDRSILQVEDQLSDPEAVAFWKRHFEEDYNFNDRGPITLTQFCEAVHLQFESIFTSIIDRTRDNDGAPTVDDLQLLDAFEDEVRMVISIDEEHVSLNALELFLRQFQGQNGNMQNCLSRAVESTLTTCCLKQKTLKNSQINETIVSELQEVKVMLDEKARSLSEKEKALKKKQQEFEGLKRQWMKKLHTEFEDLCKKQEAKLNKDFAALNRKMLQVERNLTNKVKLVGGSSNTSLVKSQSSLLKSSMRKDQPAAGPTPEYVKQLKSRITNLEKSYELQKQKNTQLETEVKKKTEECKLQSEEIASLKAAKSRLSKELKSLKEASQQLRVEDLIPTKDDSNKAQLDLGQSLKSSMGTRPLTFSKQKTPTRSGSAKKQQMFIDGPASHQKPLPSSSSGADTSSYIQMVNSLFSIIEKTLGPIVHSTIQAQLSMRSPEDSAFELQEVEPVRLCELLYPAFNTIVPALLENVVPFLSKMGSDDYGEVLAVTHSLLGFTFKTQIFDKIIASGFKSLVDQQGGAKRDRSPLLIIPLWIREHNMGGQKPVHLQFEIKSQVVKAKCREVAQVYFQREESSDLQPLPLFEIFSDPVHQQVFIDYLKKTVDGDKEKSIQLKLRLYFMIIMTLQYRSNADIDYLAHCLQIIKDLISKPDTKEEAIEFIFTKCPEGLTLFNLLALLPHRNKYFSNVKKLTLTILLTLSFAPVNPRLVTFASLLTEPTTFSAFQMAFLEEDEDLSDFIVILQKLSQLEPESLLAVIHQEAVVKLNRTAVKLNSSSEPGDKFIVSNIKSILKNLES